MFEVIKKMNDLFRAIFGGPTNDQYGKRMDETTPNDYRDNFTRNSGDDMADDYDDGEMGMNPSGGFFDFSIFNDPTAMHRQFESLINEMNRAFGAFKFGGSSSIAFEDETPHSETPCQRTENLRDLYLKQPEGVCNGDNQNNCNQVNIKLNESGTSGSLMSNGPVLTKGFSKFVFIQKVRKPDGSVEITQKVRDHTGNEETTITRTNINDPLLPPQDNQPTSKDDSGLSLLKKFFSF